MKGGKLLNIYCKCKYKLFRYYKLGKGRIIKCFVGRIHEDNVGLKGIPTYSKPLCPQCKKEIGIIVMIRGEPAIKFNNGTIQSVRV